MIEEIEAKIQETVDTATDEQQVIRKAQASQAVKASSKGKRNGFDCLKNFIWGQFMILLSRFCSKTKEITKEFVGKR